MTGIRTPLRIRVLRQGDEGVLDTVAPDVFDDPIDARAAREFLADPRHRLTVATDDGVVVGFVSAVLYVHPDKPAPELWINEVGVAPSHQGCGIARRLLASTLEDARASGCREAWVLTDRVNHAAMRLYEAGGGQASEGHVMFTFRLDGLREGL
jgi:ribosomal protein S18 acetylase RimI-like enzyme